MNIVDVSTNTVIDDELLMIEVEFDIFTPVAAPYPKLSIMFPNKRLNAGTAAPKIVAAIVPIINSA